MPIYFEIVIFNNILYFYIVLIFNMIKYNAS